MSWKRRQQGWLAGCAWLAGWALLIRVVDKVILILHSRAQFGKPWKYIRSSTLPTLAGWQGGTGRIYSVKVLLVMMLSHHSSSLISAEQQSAAEASLLPSLPRTSETGQLAGHLAPPGQFRHSLQWMPCLTLLLVAVHTL